MGLLGLATTRGYSGDCRCCEMRLRYGFLNLTRDGGTGALDGAVGVIYGMYA